MSNEGWFKVVDEQGRLGKYHLQLGGKLYYEGRPVGTVEGNQVIADYQIGHFDKPNEPVKCRGQIDRDTLKMDNGDTFKLVEVEAPEVAG